MRYSLISLMRDLFQAVPEIIFKADARLTAANGN